MSRTLWAKRCVPWWIGLCLGLSQGTGCVTPGEARARREAGDREDYLLITEQVRRLEGRVEGTAMELEALRRDLAGLRQDMQRGRGAESETLRSAVAALDERVNALDAARQRDRQEIVERLSEKVTALIQQRFAPGPRRGSGSDYGYEHVVANGENLSKIAQAYGTTVAAIVEANGLDDPDQVRVGQKLFIPE
jgi:nucleoid-associated protein YgaU